jgi:hypothetical protein
MYEYHAVSLSILRWSCVMPWRASCTCTVVSPSKFMLYYLSTPISPLTSLLLLFIEVKPLIYNRKFVTNWCRGSPRSFKCRGPPPLLPPSAWGEAIEFRIQWHNFLFEAIEQNSFPNYFFFPAAYICLIFSLLTPRNANWIE